MDCTITNRSVRCTGVSIMRADSKRTASRGDLVTFKTYFKDGRHKITLGRVIGRVNAPALEMGEKPIRGHLAIMVLAAEGWHVYERWVNPKDVVCVKEIHETALDVFAMRELPPTAALREYLNGKCSKTQMMSGGKPR